MRLRYSTLTFQDFKKHYLKYQVRYDLVWHQKNGYDETTYEVYDKYSPELVGYGLTAKEGNIVARNFNVEDNAYLRELYYYLMDHPVFAEIESDNDTDTYRATMAKIEGHLVFGDLFR